jgi:ferredoxin
VINLPKLKTHMFMTLSAAIKNLFGVIPGLNKAAHHARLNDPKRFAHMLLDLAGLVAPRLNIVDAVLGMEGDGPGSGGTPRTIGALLAGADAVLVDVACCRIIGMDTNAVPTLVAARERHMWSGHATDVETLGVPIADLRVEGFVMPGSMTGIGVGPLGLMEEPARRFLRRFNKWPVPKTGRCTLCGSCERGCPAGAISLEQAAEVARVDDSKCIRCYCCHEVCPEAAIDLEYSWMGAFLHRMRVV